MKKSPLEHGTGPGKGEALSSGCVCQLTSVGTAVLNGGHKVISVYSRVKTIFCSIFENLFPLPCIQR